MRVVKNFVNFYQQQDTYLFWSVSSSLFLAFLLIFLLSLNFSKLPSQIPLFYSLPWGDPQLATLPQFLLLPSMIILTILINLIITWHLHLSQSLIKRILSVSTFIISLIISIAGLKVILTFI